MERRFGYKEKGEAKTNKLESTGELKNNAPIRLQHFAANAPCAA